MSLTGCQMTFLHKFIFIFIMMLCFAGIFFTYYKPDFHFSTFDICMTRGNHSCQCPVDAVKHGSNLNSSSEQKINQDPTDIQKIQDDAEPDTVVLIWFWPFGKKFDLSCEIFNIQRCHLTVNRSLYHKAHGVLIHHRDIGGNNLPREPRPWFQKWVWFNMESPTNSRHFPNMDQLFNLTSNYRLDSNIPVPGGHLEPVEPGEEAFKLPTKDKLVCWIVSNWNVHYTRVKFYIELKKHVTITVYGGAFGKRISKIEYNQIVSSCKFYLSFENSVHKDYISEKLYYPMLLGTVPVTLGPPRLNYQDHVPAESFIHVEDFPTAKELADRLLYLDQNDAEYMKYFEWKKRYKISMPLFGRTHACKTCSYLQQHRGYEAFQNLKKWYWG